MMVCALHLSVCPYRGVNLWRWAGDHVREQGTYVNMSLSRRFGNVIIRGQTKLNKVAVRLLALGTYHRTWWNWISVENARAHGFVWPTSNRVDLAADVTSTRRRGLHIHEPRSCYFSVMDTWCGTLQCATSCHREMEISNLNGSYGRCSNPFDSTCAHCPVQCSLSSLYHYSSGLQLGWTT
jgi:hypothetical protein